MENNSGENKDFNGAKQNGSKKTLSIILLVLSVAGALYFAKWFAFRLAYLSTDDAQADADMVPVSTKVAGRIAEIKVSTGDHVKAGQVLAIIDPTDYELALKLAEEKLEIAKQDYIKAQYSLSLTMSRAKYGTLNFSSMFEQSKGQHEISATREAINLDRLKNELERAKSAMKKAEDRLSEAKTVTEQAEADARRAKNLLEKGVASSEQYEKAKTNAEVAADRQAQAEQEKFSAQKALELAKNNLKSAEIDDAQTKIAMRDREKAGYALDLSKAQNNNEASMAQATLNGLLHQVNAMETAVEQAREALEETTIVSPVDGIVARKIALPQEVVPVGKPILFVIDTSSVWVTANIEETNLDAVRKGYKAVVRIDALPGRKFDGVVKTVGAAANSKFALIPQSNASGQFIKVTQRIPVKITLSGDVSELKPGMNANVTIKRRQGAGK